MSSSYDIIIAGAGASGLFCAMTAARSGKRVLILEKQKEPARKLRMAGGGKANFGNREVRVADYTGDNPAFAGPALKAFPAGRFAALLAEHDIPVEEREYGQLFCRRSAADIIDLLRGECEISGCRLVRESPVDSAEKSGGEDGGFRVFSSGREYHCTRLVLASGSPAWPLSGADDSGLRLARQLGHRIIPPRPVLTPLILPENSPLTELAGVSAPVRISCDVPDSPSFAYPLLFTHKGISGPAALQISCYWRKGSRLSIDFLPEENITALLDAKESGKMTPKGLLSRLMPERLATALLLSLPQPASATRKCAELSRAQRAAIHAAIHAYGVTPLRSAGMARAEACAGGVDTTEIAPKSMESRLVPGLFFCGEIVDIAGRLGGYNLHWAWASAYTAGLALGK
ncbi:NAD(P)/FAD-dependent oxidoreductase [Desulfovibrio sp. OttesenSCG-928-I05]|nr:NAD(P)/FAD-dependent oxidoreductase [Desulfovibrio sp. OttesenSCG-928-I05]